MVQRRELKRFEKSISLNMRLLGVFIRPLTVNVRTRNVSLEGLSIELSKQQGSLNLIPYLILDGNDVALHMKLPPKDELIRAIGRIIWSQSGSRKDRYSFKAGIFLEEIEDRIKWIDFLRNIAEVKERSES